MHISSFFFSPNVAVQGRFCAFFHSRQNAACTCYGRRGGRFHMRVEAWYRLTTPHHPAQFLKWFYRCFACFLFLLFLLAWVQHFATPGPAAVWHEGKCTMTRLFSSLFAEALGAFPAQTLVFLWTLTAGGGNSGCSCCPLSAGVWEQSWDASHM